MQKKQRDKELRIDKLGVISLDVDRTIGEYNDLHDRLLNDWKPKTVQRIKDTKTQIQDLIRRLTQLYKENSVDLRASYVQTLILKLKKAVSTQLELNIIMSPKDSLNNSKFQSQLEEPVKIQSQQIRNRVNKVVQQQKSKPKKTPTKDTKKVGKFSPLKKEQFQSKKGRVIVNNLQSKKSDKAGNANTNSNRFNEAREFSALDKIGSAKFNKRSDNFMRMQELDNTEKLENLMLTIKMTKEEYFQYMRDS